MTTPLAYEIITDGADGQFVINGDRLDVAKALTPGVYPLQVRATHPDGWSVTKDISVTVLADPNRKTFSRSSVGVFQGQKLIRTIWNERPLINTIINENLWDGLDDSGNVPPSGDYTIRVLDASGVSWEWLGIVGNNSPAPPAHRWAPMDTVFSMAITAAGKAYVAAGYDEGRVGSHAFYITDPLDPYEVLPTTFRVTGPVSLYTATDGTRAYFAGWGQIPNNTANRRSAVWGVNVADDTAYTFSSGASFQGFAGGQTIASAVSIITAEPLCTPTGLAVQTTGNLLVVTRAAMNRLDILNKLTGALIATDTSLTAPKAVRFDPLDEGLWIVHSTGGSPLLEKYTVDPGTGALTLVPGTTITGLLDPLAIAVTADGDTIRVADGGTSQQIKSFTLGADVLGGDGAFASATNWTLPSGHTISGGTLNGDGTNASALINHTADSVAGKRYKVTYTITRVAGSMRVRVGTSGAALGASRSASGTYTDYLYAASANDISVQAFNFQGTVDNLIIREMYASMSTYGQATGYALGVDVTKDKLWFYNQNPITMGAGTGPNLGIYGGPMAMLEHQADGKLWVTDAGNRRVMRFSISGTAFTYDTEIAWLGTNYSAVMNLKDARQILLDWLEFEVDYTKDPTDPGWWTLVRNWHWNVPQKYNSGQLRHSRFSTLPNGRRYVQSRNLVEGGIELAELSPTGVRYTGATALLGPTGMAPDGDFRTVNSPNAGSPIVFKKRTLTGFNGSNNPIHAAEETVLTTPPVGANDTTPRSVTVDVATWEVTPGGVIPVWDPRYQFKGWHLSGVDSVTGEYRWKAMPTTPTNFATGFPVWPGDGFFSGTSVSSAGNQIYQSGEHILAGYHGEGASGYAQVNKWFHFLDCGLMVQNFGPILEGDGRQQIGMAGNAVRGGVTLMGDDLYLCHNDESYSGGIHVWKASGLDSLAFYEHNFTWDAASYTPVPPDQNNLLEGLPFNSSLTSGTAGWTRYPLTDDLTSSGVGPYWRVATNFVEYDRFRTPDLQAQHLVATDEGYIVRALPSGLGAQWTLSALVRLNRGDTGTSVATPWGYCYTEVLDASDRVIARWKAHDHPPSSLWGIYGNGQAIATFASLALLDAAINTTHVRLTIRTDASGNVLFKFGDYDEITTTPLNPSADWSAPAKFRVIFDIPTVGGGYSRRINFKELRID